MLRLIVASIVVIALVVPPSTAIKCYMCVSKRNEACKDPRASPGGINMTECSTSNIWTPDLLKDLMPGIKETGKKLMDAIGLGSGSSSTASKTPSAQMVCAKGSFKVDDELVIVRGCAPSVTMPNDGANSAPKGSGFCELVKKMSEGDLEHCEFCDQDGCNASPPTAAITTALILVGPLLSFLFRI